MIRILLVLLAATSWAQAQSSLGIGALPLSSDTVSMWMLDINERGASQPLVLVYFTGPADWHRQRWETDFQSNRQPGSPGTYRLISASTTLEIAVSGDRTTFSVQGEEFSAAESNVFVVSDANDPTRQRVQKIGRLVLPPDTKAPVSVVVLRENPELRERLP